MQKGTTAADTVENESHRADMETHGGQVNPDDLSGWWLLLCAGHQEY